MKKDKTFYPENNQENEDVYTLHPGNAIIYKSEKNNEEDISQYNEAGNLGSNPTKMELRLLVHSHSMMLNRIIETGTNQPPLL